MASTTVFLAIQEHDLDRAGEADVLPLRLDLRIKARERLGTDRVRDDAEFLAQRDRIAAHARGWRWFGALVRELRDQRRSPWLEGVSILEVRELLFVLSYYQALFEAVLARGCTVRISADCDYAQDWTPALLSHIWLSLVTVARRYQAEGHPVEIVDAARRPVSDPSRHPLVRLASRGLSAALGYGINRLAQHTSFLLKPRQPVSFEQLPRADVLLLGIQITDSVRQVRLARLLERRLQEKFLWIRLEADARLEWAERALLGEVKEVRNALRSEDIRYDIWRSWRLKTLSHASVTWDLAKAIRKVCRGLKLTRLETYNLLVLLLHSEVPLLWRRWGRILSSVNPRLAMGNSAIHEMAVPIAWCRRAGIPFCLIPTGAYHDWLNIYFLSTGDHLFQYGRDGQAMMKQTRLFPVKARTPVCGPIFLKDEVDVARSSLSHSADSTRAAAKLLFLETLDLSFAFMISPGQWEKWMKALARACAGAGVALVLRPHPRDPRGGFYEKLSRELEREGVVIELDTQHNLIEAVAASCAFTARCFDTACMKAMLFGRPFLVFLPDRMWPPIDRFLRRSGTAAASQAEMSEHLRRVRHDEEFRARCLAKQDRFLNQYFDFSIQDGWSRIADYVTDQV